jgi:hypothetical protein
VVEEKKKEGELRKMASNEGDGPSVLAVDEFKVKDRKRKLLAGLTGRSSLFVELTGLSNLALGLLNGSSEASERFISIDFDQTECTFGFRRTNRWCHVFPKVKERKLEPFVRFSFSTASSLSARASLGSIPASLNALSRTMHRNAWAHVSLGHFNNPLR